MTNSNLPTISPALQEAPILIIDDDEQLAEILSIELESCGYAVEAFAHPQPALQRLAVAEISLVLLDLRLGELDGLEVLARLREIDANVPVLMITAHGDVESAVTAFGLGVNGYLRKPFREGELKQKVAITLEQMQARSGARHFLRNGASLKEGASADTIRRTVCTRDPAMEPVLRRIALAAHAPSSVVITGESGTGKELVARALHSCGARREGPFVAINCAALPETLLESELFGHVRGAFTDAKDNKQGLFSRADGGTLFLDEIGDAPLSIQTKLLRVLQEREFTPIGGTQPVRVDVRVIAATHKSLQAEVEAGRFRQDLFFRLHVIPIHIPALRERPADIMLLAHLFATKFSERIKTRFEGFTESARDALIGHDWPGNVRELQNRVEHALVLGTGARVASNGLFPELKTSVGPAEQVREADEVLVVGSGPEAGGNELEAAAGNAPGLPTFSEAKNRFERNYLERILSAARGNIAKAARLASKSRTEVYSLLKKHNLNPAAFKSGREASHET